jgi:hypothetical protein
MYLWLLQIMLGKLKGFKMQREALLIECLAQSLSRLLH